MNKDSSIVNMLLVSSVWSCGEKDSDGYPLPRETVEVYAIGGEYVYFSRRGGQEEVFFNKEQWDIVLEFIKKELENANTNS